MFNISNKNQKYICGSGTGLNDFFSMVATVINTAALVGINLKNLYFYHGSKEPYEDLNKYLDFFEINYINRTEYEANAHEFKLLPAQPSGNTNVGWGTPYHLRNFVKYKQEIVQEALQYAAPVGMHFRCMSLEAYINNPNKQKEITEELEYYKKIFFKKYDEKQKYFCCTDSIKLYEFLTQFNNIKILTKHDNVSILNNRQRHTREAILDLAILSNCNKIYFTRGRFTELALALNNKIKQTALSHHIEEKQHRQILNFT